MEFEKLERLNDLLEKHNCAVQNLSFIHGFYTAHLCLNGNPPISYLQAAIFTREAVIPDEFIQSIPAVEYDLMKTMLELFYRHTEHSLLTLEYEALLNDNEITGEEDLSSWILGFYQAGIDEKNLWNSSSDEWAKNDTSLTAFSAIVAVALAMKHIHSDNPDAESPIPRIIGTNPQEYLNRTTPILLENLNDFVEILYCSSVGGNMPALLERKLGINPMHTMRQKTSGMQSIRSKSKVSRNDPCPCGSGKKYKKCCLKG